MSFTGSLINKLKKLKSWLFNLLHKYVREKDKSLSAAILGLTVIPAAMHDHHFPLTLILTKIHQINLTKHHTTSNTLQASSQMLNIIFTNRQVSERMNKNAQRKPGLVQKRLC
jgi:hypothetical protein